MGHPNEKRIGLAPFDNVEQKLLLALASSLEKIFTRQVNVLKPMGIPPDAYNPRRGQYLSTSFLKILIKIKKKDFEAILGITDVDLYVPQLNFVFGEADPWNRVAVISLLRLRQEHYGLPANEKLLLERALKEAVHELGHVYGLGHCPDPRCVMHFSNSLADTDRKGHMFCPNCRRKLKWMLK